MGGMGHGFSQLTMMCTYALCFWAGAQFIKNGWMDFEQLMTSFFAIAMSAVGLGHASAFAVDASKAEAAKRSMFALIDRPSAIDPDAPAAPLASGGAPDVEAGYVAAARGAGRLELRNVKFAYPTRPDVPVLRGIDLTIEPGTTVALVGPSGCGKSSIIQQLLRFYDPAEGGIFLDGVDIRQLSPAAYRSDIAWVQQEAPLFADSIAYNVAYGTSSPDKAAPEGGVARDAAPDAPVPAGFAVPAGVQAAAEAANAHGFISDFKHGYATFTGERGSQLSGGQKQRVAIARAIVRAPRVLLLDEATSALDSESERLVSETLERLIAAGKASPAPVTVVLIAHRLSTVKHADVIVVIDAGRVVESGSHDALLANTDGLYRKLALAQDAHAADHLPPPPPPHA